MELVAAPDPEIEVKEKGKHEKLPRRIKPFHKPLPESKNLNLWKYFLSKKPHLLFLRSDLIFEWEIRY